jgi:hypothetical protein
MECKHPRIKRIAIANVCATCNLILKNIVSPKPPKNKLELIDEPKTNDTIILPSYYISSTVNQNIQDNLSSVYKLPLFTSLTPPDTQIRDDIIHIFSHTSTLSRAKTTSTYAFYFMAVIIHTICNSQPLNITHVANHICKQHKTQVKSFKYNMHIILSCSKYHTKTSFYKSIIQFIISQINKPEFNEYVQKWTQQIIHFENSFVGIREFIGQKKISINTFKLMTSYIPIFIHEQIYGNSTPITSKYANCFIINKSKATIIRIKSDLKKVFNEHT